MYIRVVLDVWCTSVSFWTFGVHQSRSGRLVYIRVVLDVWCTLVILDVSGIHFMRLVRIGNGKAEKEAGYVAAEQDSAGHICN